LPSDVISGLSDYPDLEEIFGALHGLAAAVIRVDAARLAEKSGNTMTVNIVMLGALTASGLLPISSASIEEAIRQGVPPKTVDVNLKAFKLGVDAVPASTPS
jgi:indolepyruvate ferredoxin oxidoreductase beta subunit